VRIGSGGQYSRAIQASALGILGEQVRSVRITVVFLAVGLAAVIPRVPAPPATRRAARTWSAALLGALFYKPIHPVVHLYLDHPLRLIWSIEVAVLVAWILPRRQPFARLRSVAILIITGLAVGGVPAYCSLARSLDAPRILASGSEPLIPPLGYARNVAIHEAAHYSWDDYRAALDYLRKRTAPDTRVATVLKELPAINGAVGRLSPFAIESGLVWIRVAAARGTLEAGAVEDQFIRALERTPDSVVVWVPDEDVPGVFPIERLAAAIRRHYLPEVRFQTIEVWRRRAEPGARSSATTR
jgi:hypothetical protein